tara:strand:- start:5641 stop:7110 length:1470 start_codon:yes stop_codon:yes gene_type:complete
LITLGWYDVKKGSSVKILEIIPIQLIIPEKIRTLLKNTLFYVPNLQNLSDQQNKKLKNFTNIQRHSNELWDIASSMDFKIINSYAVSKKSIKTDKNIYTLKNFSLPFPNIITSKRKPVGYLEIYNDLILLASGNGTFFSIDKSSIAKSIKKDNTELQDNIDFDKHGDVIYSSKKDTLALSKIKTNFRNITNDKNLIKPGKSSIRDLLIFNEKIFVSYTKKISENCYNTSILKSDLDLSYLNFSEFFSYEECHLTNDFDNAGSGGRMVFYKDNKILLTIGVAKQVVTKKKLAQNEKSFFGKIISIDLKTKDYQLVSMGHRNAQGLYYNNQDDLIISTEHGPRGGDEININKNPDNLIIENYGWPISSYGEHYDKNTKPALLNSHKDFGFQEPIKYYNPAIGISEIIKIPPEFNKKFTNDFFVGAMGRLSWEGDLSIHHIRFDKNFNKIIFEEIIPLEERVRDMIYLEEEKIVLMVLENTPSIGILKISNQ